MVRVWTPSRLHFGLLGFAVDGEAWPDRRGARMLPARRFGGVGLMVERPGLRLAATTAKTWSAEGPLAERALLFARRFAESIRLEKPDADLPPQHLIIEEAPAEHIGLGVGTQLGLAVGRALALAWGYDLDASDLARRVGRGLRSALGVYGFAHGGFLVESGKRCGQEETLAPLAIRRSFPSEWRVVLVTPHEAPGLHGAAEREAFAHLAAARRDVANRRFVPAGAARHGRRPWPKRTCRRSAKAFTTSTHAPVRRSPMCRAASTPGRTSPNAWRFCEVKACAAWDRVRGGRRCSPSWATRIARPICYGDCRITFGSGFSGSMGDGGV